MDDRYGVQLTGESSIGLNCTHHVIGGVEEGRKRPNSFKIPLLPSGDTYLARAVETCKEILSCYGAWQFKTRSWGDVDNDNTGVPHTSGPFD